MVYDDSRFSSAAVVFRSPPGAPHWLPELGLDWGPQQPSFCWCRPLYWATCGWFGRSGPRLINPSILNGRLPGSRGAFARAYLHCTGRDIGDLRRKHAELPCLNS